jgi:hypothetical protein
LFIGVADESSLDAYLHNIEYDELTRVTHWLSFRDLKYDRHSGTGEPPSPLVHSFWIISRNGPGTQGIEWEPVEGSYSLVFMNSDGSSGIDMNAVFKVQVPTIVFALGVGLLVAGTVTLLTGIVMVYFGARKR